METANTLQSSIQNMRNSCTSLNQENFTKIVKHHPKHLKQEKDTTLRKATKALVEQIQEPYIPSYDS
jgi:endonuclease IV